MPDAAPDAMHMAPGPATEAPPLDQLFAGVAMAPPTHPPAAGAPSAASARPARRRAATAPRAPRRPLPSRAVLLIGLLTLTSLTLVAALVLTSANAPQAAAPADAPSPIVAAAGGGTEPQPVPADALARLDAAADAPLPTELEAFLVALSLSFGEQGTAVDAGLQPYAYRLTSRFEWNPDTHTVRVTAPHAALAAARGAVLDSLFADAAAAGRLIVRTASGPHALSLVTE